jgi:hypothetical protein
LATTNDKKYIEGAWIPAEVLFNPQLTYTDMFIFWRINSYAESGLDCYAKNDQFLGALGIGEHTVRKSIYKLENLGYVKAIERDGKRVLFVNKDYKKIYQTLAEITYENLILGEKNIPNWEKKISVFKDRYNNLRYNYSSAPKVAEDAELHSATKVFDSYPPKVKELFMFWNEFEYPIKHHTVKAKNKSFIEALRCLNKKLSEGFIPEEIAKAMTLYCMMLDNPEQYLLVSTIPGHRVGLNEFFGFDLYTRERFVGNVANNFIVKIESWFDECIKGKKYLIEKYGRFIPDQYPESTARLKLLWNKYKFGSGSLLREDENKFRAAAIEFEKFMSKKRHKIRLPESESQKNSSMIKYIYESIKADVGDEIEKVTPGWLCSKYTFSYRLPKYFIDNGMMHKEEG